MAVVDVLQSWWADEGSGSVPSIDFRSVKDNPTMFFLNNFAENPVYSRRYGGGRSDYLDGGTEWSIFAGTTINITNNQTTSAVDVMVSLEVNTNGGAGEFTQIGYKWFTVGPSSFWSMTFGAVVNFDHDFCPGTDCFENKQVVARWKAYANMLGISDSAVTYKVSLNPGSEPVPTATPTKTPTPTFTPTFTPTPLPTNTPTPLPGVIKDLAVTGLTRINHLDYSPGLGSREVVQGENVQLVIEVKNLVDYPAFGPVPGEARNMTTDGEVFDDYVFGSTVAQESIIEMYFWWDTAGLDDGTYTIRFSIDYSDLNAANNTKDELVYLLAPTPTPTSPPTSTPTSPPANTPTLVPTLGSTGTPTYTPRATSTPTKVIVFPTPTGTPPEPTATATAIPTPTIPGESGYGADLAASRIVVPIYIPEGLRESVFMGQVTNVGSSPVNEDDVRGRFILVPEGSPGESIVLQDQYGYGPFTTTGSYESQFILVNRTWLPGTYYVRFEHNYGDPEYFGDDNNLANDVINSVTFVVATSTPNISFTPTATFTPSPTSTFTPVPTNTPGPTPTKTNTPVATPTNTFTPTATPTKWVNDLAVTTIVVPSYLYINDPGIFPITVSIKNIGTSAFSAGELMRTRYRSQRSDYYPNSVYWWESTFGGEAYNFGPSFIVDETQTKTEYFPVALFPRTGYYRIRVENDAADVPQKYDELDQNGVNNIAYSSDVIYVGDATYTPTPTPTLPPSPTPTYPGQGEWVNDLAAVRIDVPASIAPGNHQESVKGYIKNVGDTAFNINGSFRWRYVLYNETTKHDAGVLMDDFQYLTSVSPEITISRNSTFPSRNWVENGWYRIALEHNAADGVYSEDDQNPSNDRIMSPLIFIGPTFTPTNTPTVTPTPTITPTRPPLGVVLKDGSKLWYLTRTNKYP